MYSATDFQEQFDVSRETMEKLECYAALLIKWQKKINLVSPVTLKDMWLRHFADSAQLYPLVPEGCGLDFGSGAGFPGAVLAIMGADITLVESDTRKCAFLREVARQTDTPFAIITERIENLEHPDVSYVTARALADLSRLLDYAAPLLGQGGKCLFLKGENYKVELARAAGKRNFTYEIMPSISDSTGVILEISNVDVSRET